MANGVMFGVNFSAPSIKLGKLLSRSIVYGPVGVQTSTFANLVLIHKTRLFERIDSRGV
jgi:hypothetical protein